MLVRNVRLPVFRFALREIIINGFMKVIQEFSLGCAFVGNQGFNMLNLSEKDTICFGELYAAFIALIFHQTAWLKAKPKIAVALQGTKPITDEVPGFLVVQSDAEIGIADKGQELGQVIAIASGKGICIVFLFRIAAVLLVMEHMIQVAGHEVYVVGDRIPDMLQTCKPGQDGTLTFIPPANGSGLICPDFSR